MYSEKEIKANRKFIADEIKRVRNICNVVKLYGIVIVYQSFVGLEKRNFYFEIYTEADIKYNELEKEYNKLKIAHAIYFIMPKGI